MESLGLYIHIPFCEKKCRYCAFLSYDGSSFDMRENYVKMLNREIMFKGSQFSNNLVDTIYIGGGTPTILEINQLIAIIRTLRSCFSVSDHAEISIESNPGTVTEAKAFALASAGVNRVSMGVQSFNADVLSTIGRIHSAEEVYNSTNIFKQAGITNLNMDFMYGLPGQTTTDLENSLQVAVELEVSHLSVYGLKLEENTPFFDLWENKALIFPSEEEEEEMYELVNRFLPRCGYNRYEVSNFAKPGKECHHNMKYWRYLPYLGMGSGAASFQGNHRWTNIEDLNTYEKNANENLSLVGEEEFLSKNIMMAEFLFLGLRTVTGIDENEFYKRFDTTVATVYGKRIESFLQGGYLEYSQGFYRLTPQGMKISNQIFTAFLPS